MSALQVISDRVALALFGTVDEPSTRVR